MSIKTRYLIFIALTLLIIFLIFLDLSVGDKNISIAQIFRILFSGDISNSEDFKIISVFRFPRVLTAIAAGAGLSVSGLQMQTVFRNPLAGPYVLGISSGAGLGVAVVVLGGSLFSAFTGIAGSWTIVIAAWIGAGIILLLIFAVSIRVNDIMTILILGIMFGAAISAIVSLLQYFSHEAPLKTFVLWTMGSLGSVTTSQLYVLIPSIILGLIISLLSSKVLNALLLGENYAKSLGLNIKLSRLLIFFSTSILAGSITAFCGPIGFVGIAVPHVTRFIFKTSNHNTLIIGSILTGIILLLVSDIISQLPGYNSTIPINSVTALLGIPIVIWIIIRNYKMT